MFILCGRLLGKAAVLVVKNGKPRYKMQCPLNSHSHNNCRKRPTSFKGPIRIIRLCILGILVPGLLVSVPLYMRYHVYGYQLYPLAVSDMRLVDNKVSTTWCQRQLVSVNATFNAFLLSDSPTVAKELKPLSMVRHLSLEDDTKEYWGFYLLKGSAVTVSTCVRWPGASLIMIRGHKHLHECAYIGDDSSEELDEMMEAIREGSYVPQKDKVAEEPPEIDDPSPANKPTQMKRHRQEVEFHHPIHKTNSTNTTSLLVSEESADITDPKLMKKILESLSEKKKKDGDGEKKEKKKKEDEEDENHHVHRNVTIAKDEKQFMEILQKTGNGSSSQEVLEQIYEALQGMGNKKSEMLERLNEKMMKGQMEIKQQIENGENLHDVRGRQYSKPSVKYEDNIDRARRRRREIILETALGRNLTDNDEENDAALEEGFVPDGIADHRGTINETTANDMSNSEFWSSFSSSEEALLNCAGLILNLPLTPHKNCRSNLTEKEAEEAYLANTVTYKVPTNGYYFFVFNSENEVQTNYLRVLFHIKKAVYNVSNAVAKCTNATRCALDFDFFSSEKVVMELPVSEDDSLWNEEFVVISECEPRTAIYVACIIAVPVFVILFAFG